MFGIVKCMDSLLHDNFHDYVTHSNNLHLLIMVLKRKFDDPLLSFYA